MPADNHNHDEALRELHPPQDDPHGHDDDEKMHHAGHIPTCAPAQAPTDTTTTSCAMPAASPARVAADEHDDDEGNKALHQPHAPQHGGPQTQ